MRLKQEKDITVAVEINGAIFIGSENGVLYQHLDDDKDEILLYIKSNNEPKEIKIKISKENVNSES